ncbi:MAG: DUF1015 domain-containing protein [Chloroflexi bacterium]|nr:DUF1015 domain-containing protein [Chloroflexota bacterium]
MADIRPFRGLRYNSARITDLSAVVTPPYDVISSEAQLEYYARCEYNIVRLELGLELEGDDDRENKYTRAASCFTQWRREGVLLPEVIPAMYVYEQEFSHDGRRTVRRGLLAALKLEEWDKGVVLPHEDTLPKPLSDRFRLVQACNANLSPVFGLYDGSESAVDNLLESVVAAPPDVRLVDEDGDEHRLWVVVDQPALRNLHAGLLGNRVFIADGHHRYLTALRYRDEIRRTQPGAPDDAAFNFVMMLLVSLDDPGLVVLPTHRQICDLDHDALGRLETELAVRFDIQHLPLDLGNLKAQVAAVLDDMNRTSGALHTFAACGLRNGHLSVLRLRADVDLDRLMSPERSRPWKELDVSVLHTLIVDHALSYLGRSQVDDKVVSFTRDATQAVRATLEGVCALALLLNSPTVQQVRDVALAGDRMPQKSTYFHPKPLTGLVINHLVGVLPHFY